MDYVEREFQAVFKGHSFMTAGCLVLSPDQGRVTFCGAGQPPLLDRPARRHGRVHPLRPPAARPQQSRPQHRGKSASLAPGEALLLYTDGLYEMQNPAGERLGTTRSAPAASASSMQARRGLARAGSLESVGAYAGFRAFPG